MGAWLWFAAAVVVDELTTYVLTSISQHGLDRLRSLLRAVDAAMTKSAERGPEGLREEVEATRAHYLAHYAKVRAAGEALKQVRAKPRAVREDVRAAQKAFRAAKAEARAIRRSYDEARARQARERVPSRSARRDIEDALTALANTLKVVCAGEHHDELVQSYAISLPAPPGYLRVILGEQTKRELSCEEVKEIISRRAAGTPEWALAAGYRVSPRHVRRLISTRLSSRTLT